MIPVSIDLFSSESLHVTLPLMTHTAAIRGSIISFYYLSLFLQLALPLV